MEKTNVSVYLTLAGKSFDVDYVTRKIGIAPTFTRSKDEVLGNGRLFGHTEWGIGIEEEISLDIEKQLNKILLMVHDEASILSSLSNELGAEWHFMFVVRIWDGVVPSMFLSKEFISFAAGICAQIDFDTYVF